MTGARFPEPVTSGSLPAVNDRQSEEGNFPPVRYSRVFVTSPRVSDRNQLFSSSVSLSVDGLGKLRAGETGAENRTSKYEIISQHLYALKRSLSGSDVTLFALDSEKSQATHTRQARENTSTMVVLITVSLVTIAVALVAVLMFVSRLGFRRSAYKSGSLEEQPKTTAVGAPGPKPWPILGSLHLLGQHDVPFEAFTALSKVYGDIYSITLGSTPCVIVSSFKLIKEVLITKGSHFGGRPDFIRFNILFGGDRNNSLALCDWSDLQKTRRSIARAYCSPRFASIHYDNLDVVGCGEVKEFLGELHRMTAASGGRQIYVKPVIQAACFNMFSQYMCSKRFSYDNEESRRIVRTFDEIFWEINQGYAVDFLPWLLPAYQGHMKKLAQWSIQIRQFILSSIIEEHQQTINLSEEPRDFTDALLMHLEEDPNMNSQHIIFELEDFLGGHSAIGNLVMLSLAAVARNPDVAMRIRSEVDSTTGGTRGISLFDKATMPYTEATILETLRTASSPIVPHVASQNTSIAGYTVEKGTVVFLNNYELNIGDQYWSNPQLFQPERFLSKEGNVTKPEYFIPFSTGKRMCIGQRLVQGFSFILLASIIQHFDVSADQNTEIRTYPACVAVPPDTFPLIFTPRDCSRTAV
uniref:Cytochrome P450 n=1 Tax=Timema poppense TaxID=170557 RepID=A0A7R9D1T6_TIMPO|nr:unnamed protein product [Timema poppensis]